MNSKKTNWLFLAIMLVHFAVVGILIFTGNRISLSMTANLIISEMIILLPGAVCLLVTKSGFGESLAAFAHREGSPCLVRTLGVADHFVAHASRAEQWQEEGLTPEHILSFLHVWATASA